ncbi:MAG: hypothetical protein ACI37O_00105 [Candidatus Avelusimicrobium sp.]|uniref:hypothetical protein n=1 Tax=Candidatus Avelusimicrobium sp. TaxID=3048833 RepID=UPI003F069AA2
MKRKVKQPAVKIAKQNSIDLAVLPAKERDRRLPVAGTVIIKTYHGQTLEIKVLKNGFKCKEAVNEIISFWQLKKLIEKGQPTREWEKASGMNKRTFARYLNLCYLSPKIVTDILEYRNPHNMSLKELMSLAEGEPKFSEQEKGWQNYDNM